MSEIPNVDNRMARFKAHIYRLAKGCALAGMFVVAALFYKGVVLDVEVQKVEVLSVTQVPGGDLSERLVVVDLGHRTFPIRTSDRLLIVEPGSVSCISKRHLLFRRWERYALELPGFCRSQM